MKALRVVYSSGRVEFIEGADRCVIGDRSSTTLLVESHPRVGGFARDVIKTLVLANVESYDWVEEPLTALDLVNGMREPTDV